MGIQSIPIVDLTALTNDLGAEALRLRSQVHKIRTDADALASSLTRQADYLHQLASIFRGTTESRLTP